LVLKFVIAVVPKLFNNSFNRTFLVLKSQTTCQWAVPDRVLIAPFWY